MSPLKDTPPLIRYLNAGLKSLNQPLVLTSIAVVGLTGIFLWQASVNPNWFSEDGEQNSSTGTFANADDNSAIGADIDNSDLLRKDLSSAEPSLAAEPNALSPLNLAASTPSSGLFSDLLSQSNGAPNIFGMRPANAQPSSTQQALSRPIEILGASGAQQLEDEAPAPNAPSNPFVLPGLTGTAQNEPSQNQGSSATKNGTMSTAGSAQNRFLSPNDSSSLNSLSANPSSNPEAASNSLTPSSPLLGQTSGQSSRFNSQYSTVDEFGRSLNAPNVTAPGINGGMNYSNMPAGTSLPNSYTYINNQPAGADVPAGTMPAVGAGVPVAPVPNAGAIAPAPYGYPAGNYNPYNQVDNGSGYPTVNNQPAPTLPTNTVPFSTPRSTPGRYIGGGRINTFSNP